MIAVLARPYSDPIQLRGKWDGDDMRRFDYFTGAREMWRASAARRAKQVRVDHGTDAMNYVHQRIARAHWSSFQRRRWSYIRKLLRADKSLG